MWDELEDNEKKYFSVMALDRMVGESKEWEHSEPGTGSPPEPRLDEESGVDDPAQEGGWRRGTPPDQDVPGSPSSSANGKEGGKEVAETTYAFTEKEAFDLFKVLDLDHDTKPEKVIEKVQLMFGELAEYQKNQDVSEQEKQFAEKYPQFWEEHNKLMERTRTNEAKEFSESVKTLRKAEGRGLKTLNQGLSPVAMEKVIETHKKFSDKTVTVEDFEDCLKSIMNGGVIQFGEIGSSGDDDDVPVVDTTSPNGVAQARKVFAEVIADIQRKNPEMQYAECVDEAAKKHPDLAEAYKITLPA